MSLFLLFFCFLQLCTVYTQVEAVLAQALNAAHASCDWSIAVAISDRFLAALEAPSGLSSDLGSLGCDQQKTRRSQLLVLRTQALLGLGRLSDAARSADQAMTLCPSADAFVLQVLTLDYSLYS
jgi:hypothetical protein